MDEEHDDPAQSMVIPEIGEKDVLAGLTDTKAAILFVTPLCGTCLLTEKMLGIAQAAGAGVPLYKLNINYAPVLRDSWRIASVPCLVLIRDGQPAGSLYAPQGVDHLYATLKSFREAD